MKLTENILKKIIREELGNIMIDKKNVSGDELILAQLNRNSQFEWYPSESSKEFKGTANFDSAIDKNSFFRLSIATEKYDESFRYTLHGMLIYKNVDVYDNEFFDKVTFKNESELIRFCMSVDKHIQNWMQGITISESKIRQMIREELFDHDEDNACGQCENGVRTRYVGDHEEQFYCDCPAGQEAEESGDSDAENLSRGNSFLKRHMSMKY